MRAMVRPLRRTPRGYCYHVFKPGTVWAADFNELNHTAGWRAPTAVQLWEQRPSIDSAERASFLADVSQQRMVARAALHLPAETPLGHYPAAAVDRRAVRD